MNIRQTLKNSFRTTAASAICALMGFSVPVYAEVSTIDVMVAYTPDVSERYAGEPESRFHHLINLTNQIYADSEVELALRLVHSVEVDYVQDNHAATALQAITFKQHEAFSEIDTLRSQYGADMVIFYRSYSDQHGGCGLAWVGGNNTEGDFSASYQKDYAYSHVAVDTCGDYVTAHELGHNMGLAHSRVQDGEGGTFDHALGHGEHGSFATIMAYHTAYDVDHTHGKVYKFSNPNISCNGSACGIDHHDPEWGADASHTLNITGPQIADYFPTMVAEESVDVAQLEEAVELAQQELVIAQQDYDSAALNLEGMQQQLNDAMTGYAQSYNEYLDALNAANAALQDLYAAIDAFNAAAGQPYEVQLALYNEYVAANSVYSAAVDSFYTAADSVNAYVAQINHLNAQMPQTQLAYDQAVQVLADAQNQLNIAEQTLLLAQG